MITENLINDIKKQFHINWTGIHGLSHWARVYEIGMKLTDHTDANRTVVQLFSVFHDSGRHGEGSDPQHGLRGAYLPVQFRKTHLRSLSDDEFDMLHTACCLDTSASSHEDITIKTCFDSDRLDLGKVGTIPDPQFLCTNTAKSKAIISSALENSFSGKIPNNNFGELFS